MKKLELLILCGGQSAEHEVSINSAKNVIQALDKNKYNVHIVYITKAGAWFLFPNNEQFLQTEQPNTLVTTKACVAMTILFGDEKANIVALNGALRLKIDAAFPVLHGSHGEDGTMQGLLELANIPYVGPGVLSSAICMDKEIAKLLLTQAGLPNSKFEVMNKLQLANANLDNIIKKLGLPLFVKPVNTGSSVGISKVKTAEELPAAIKLALQYDHKVLFEEFILGREIECAVLGNGEPEVALPAEIRTHHEFYTYEAKYLDPNGADLLVPAPLSAEITAKIQVMAKQVFKTLSCESMARVDFFLTPDEKIYVNEANTIPGFTQISMYPKMWIESGVTYPELLDKLIQLGLQRFQRDRILVTVRACLPPDKAVA